MNENKISTYLLYAFGEIVLVVIGILIALSIDNWNEDRQRKTLEAKYLMEIKVSLEADVASCEKIMNLNNRRLAHLDTLLTKMQNRNQREMIASLMPNLEPSFYYDIFKMNRVGFDNMVSSESISLISNDSLRQSLSEYYLDEGEWQERIELQSRKFVDMMVPRAMSAPLLEMATGYDLPIKNTYKLRINEDPEIMNLFFSLIQTTISQNRMVNRKMGNAQNLIQTIDPEISKE
ncbi:MAG: hypothetical protein HRT61_03320 [Ekhidna sp.]|nr:hypothetical protein [Ekhidna sp.]